MLIFGAIIVHFHRKMINLKGLTIGVDLFQLLVRTARTCGAYVGVGVGTRRRE